MFANIGFAGVAVILFVVLLLWGPKKLPELGKAAGQTLRSFRQSVNGKEEDSTKKD